MTSTKARLAARIREDELPENLAMLAEAGHFDDCQSESATPITDLIRALAPYQFTKPSSKQLMRDVEAGLFDCTKEEWEAWTKRMAGDGTFANMMKHL